MLPPCLTIWILHKLVSYSNDILQELGWGSHKLMVSIVTFSTLLLVGSIASHVLFKKLMESIEFIISKVPLVNILYSYFKDTTAAFVKKKFSKPVLVQLDPNLPTQKVGFITQSSLISIGLRHKVAVYLPHSYSFSGEVHIVSKAQVTLLKVHSTNVLRFILSGGIASLKSKNRRIAAKAQNPNLSQEPAVVDHTDPETDH